MILLEGLLLGLLLGFGVGAGLVFSARLLGYRVTLTVDKENHV